jgi:hypothetical protein
MKNESFTKRFIAPVLTVFIVMTLSYIVYMLSPKVPNFTLFQILATTSALLLFLTLWFGVFYVYPKAYFRGASVGERIVASLINPFLWATKEVVVVAGVYSVPEALYFYLNPVVIWVFSAVVAQIGLSEILCRRRAKKQGKKIRVLAFAAVIAIILGVGNFMFALLWDVGVHHFYFFQEGYKAIFHPGLVK